MTEEEQQNDRPPTKRRRRIGYACNFCRVKKNRCDGERPACGQCKTRGQECVYGPHRMRISVTQEYVDGLRERNRMLEEQLASNQARISTYPQVPSDPEFRVLSERQVVDNVNGPHRYDNPRSPASGGPDGERGKKAQACLPDNFPQGRQETHTDRQSSVSEVTQQQADQVHQQPPSGTGDGSPGEYFGESSTFDFMARVGSPRHADTVSAAASTNPTSLSTNASVPISSKRKSAMLARHYKGSVESSRGGFQVRAESLAGSSPSTVVFEDLLGVGLNSGSDPFELPQRATADNLVTCYFAYRHPLSPYLHEGSFRRRYERLWLSQDAGGEEATLVWLGLVNVVFAFGCGYGSTRNQPSNSALVPYAAASDRSRFFARAKALVLSGIFQAGKIELVQALLLMGHYLHGSLELNHCWTMVGLAVRTAQELGLHLEPAQFTDDIVEQEVRKRVWWGCFAFDRQISTKLGRPPIINDGIAIRVGLPLAVDDEHLNEASGYTQPSNVPSKLEFLNHIVSQCRLVEKVLDTLYSNNNSSTDKVDTRARIKTELHDMLATSIKLDGELVAWQEGLPPHLRQDSDAPEWHFERQRNVLLMRFLHARLLIHRQALLFYVSRRIHDAFQLDLIRLCIKQCVIAACESITQMKILRQRKSLSSFWHNSHYVFAALGVLLVYQKIDSKSRAEMDILPSLDLDDVIAQGLENLERVGGEMHPLASRYVQSFHQLKSQLQAITSLSANAPLRSVQGNKQVPTRSGSDTPGLRSRSSRLEIANSNGNDENGSSVDAVGIATMDDQNQERAGSGYYNIGDGSQGQTIDDGRVLEYDDDPFAVPGFDNDFEILQSVLLSSGEWPGIMDVDWQQD
ncbi:fungal-specific transcription factor domain-containing protein [Mariannaea sp. PMI_226]|nr:fungal-specific transcription factor domain-containing protein [Mariannaea sp. PMI_226]